MNKNTFISYTIMCVSFLCISLFLGTVIHELGHGLTAMFFGGEITDICVLFLNAGEEGVGIRHCAAKGGFFGYFQYSFDDFSDKTRALVSLMGSVSTFLISILFTYVLLFYERNTRYLKYILIAFSVYFIDSLYFFTKFSNPYSDYGKITGMLDISLLPLLLINLFGASVITTIIYYRWADKAIPERFRQALFLLLSLTLVLLFLFLVYFIV